MYSPDGPYMHALLSNVFRAAGVRPGVVQALGGAQSILALVSTGMGLALVPAETRNACLDSVAFRPITVAPGAAVELHAAWRPENRNPARGPFRDLLQDRKSVE